MNEKTIIKRNYNAMLLEGTFFFTGLAFLDANSVIPVFIDTFTGSLQLTGLATTLRAASSIVAQLLIGPYMHRIKNMPSFITRTMFIFRPLPLIMVPVLFSNLNPYLTVWIFLMVYALVWGSDGFISVPWLDVFGRTIPEHRRGKLLGHQQLFGGIGGLIAGFIIKTTLQNPNLSNATKYSIIFGLAGFILFISAFAMSFVKDLPRKMKDEEKVSFFNYFRKLPGYLKKNEDYARMVRTQIAGAFTGMSLPFVILFGKKTFALTPEHVSTLIYIQIAGTLIGGILWGNISHRLGNKYVIMTSQAFGTTLSILALTSIPLQKIIPVSVFLSLMALLTGINMGAWMGYVNYTIDVVDEEERPVYFVLSSVINFPLTFLSYFAGLIADTWGFIPLFSASLVSGVGAIFLSTRLKSPE